MRRRTLKRKKQKGGSPMTDKEWAEHLFADVHHDFGDLGAGNLYHIGHQYPKEAETLRNEDGAVTYFLDHAKKDDEIFQTRLKNTIVFQLPVEMETTRHAITPKLNIAGNSIIGIVHDAGEFITTRLGCQNVLTFGSVLDPASKPIAPERKPIWKDTPTLTIGLEQYGFAKDRPGVESIKIQDFKGGSTLVGLKFPEQGMLDAVSRKVGVLTQPKIINKTSIEQSGFFTSITEAKDASFQQGDAIQRNQTYYRIGKSLGDAMLVESILQLPMGDGAWHKFEDPSQVTIVPTMFALKTLDRLNHLRAILKGVPSIFEKKPGDSRPVVQFEYVPANINDDEFNRILNAGVDQLRSDIKKRYDEVIAGLNALLEPSGSGALQHKYIRRTGSGRAVFSGIGDERTRKLKTAGEFIIKEIIPRVESLRDQKLPEFDRADKPTGADRDADIKTYNTLSKISQEISPTSSVEDERGLLTPKIVLCQTPFIAIPMLNILMNIEIGKNNTDDRTDFSNQFASRVPPPEGAGAGAGAAAASGALVGGQVFDDSIYVDGAITLTPTGRALFNELLNDFPTIKRFKDYIEGAEEDTLRLVNRLLAHYEAEEDIRQKEQPMNEVEDVNTLIPLAFEDITVLGNLRSEFDILNDLSPSLIHVEPTTLKEVRETATTTTFNRFVLDLNDELFPEYSGRVAVGAPETASWGVKRGRESGYSSESDLSQFPLSSPPARRHAKDSVPATAQGSQAPSSDEEREGAVPGVAKVLSQYFGGFGGLRRTYRKRKNARNSTSRISRTAKHSRLRKRTGTRDTRGV